MKHSIILILTIFFLFAMQSCKDECEMNDPVCLETVPNDEACLAFFEGWFYIEATNQCELIGYSGCSQKGFASEVDCENCGCN